VDLRKKAFKNLSDIEIQECYTPADTDSLNYQNDLGKPGEFPFTRGVYPTMYRGRLWTMRQFAGGVRYANADGLRLGSPARSW
jgi:methylmalonyl-CoA mutase N-terminal domain/subunit